MHCRLVDLSVYSLDLPVKVRETRKLSRGTTWGRGLGQTEGREDEPIRECKRENEGGNGLRDSFVGMS